MTPIRNLADCLAQVTPADLELLDNMALWRIQQMAHQLDIAATNILTHRACDAIDIAEPVEKTA
jgi:hypothetical protein